MSVSVQVFGSKPDSEEYQCALILKEKLMKAFPNNVVGEIYIQANATLFGQTVKDVDIIMMGVLDNYSLPLKYVDINGDFTNGNVEINSFCTVIEVKSHDINGVFRKGTEFYVKYRDGAHCVTTQSNEQKISAQRFFTHTLKQSPFITNLIWFTGLTPDDLEELLKLDNKPMLTNAMAKDFSIDELMQLLVWQKTPTCYRGKYRFASNGYNCSPETLFTQFQLFGKEKTHMGELTRKRIEQLTAKTIGGAYPDKKDMSIFRGRAGTGKTVALINTAIHIVDQENARVIILTYNKALVSDIKRIFALADLPDLFQESCVAIYTMHSFFFLIISKGMYDGRLDGDDFLENYNHYLNELYDFLQQGNDSIECLKEILSNDYRLNWDYCFIDEAQDWSKLERDLIVLIFGYQNLIVADGGQQFVRGLQGCDWNVTPNRNNIKLKYCLRQKNNLIKFVNCFSNAFAKLDSSIQSSDKMPGGRVIIYDSLSHFWEDSQQIVGELKQAGNIMYDLLFLVPSAFVDKESRHFKYIEDFEEHDIFVWDGTNEVTRSAYPIYGDEARVLQYDSSRGLEAWTVICMGFDTFLKEKLVHYVEDDNSVSALFLESAEEKRMKYLLNWALIPLTRAIDTCVIILDDNASKIAEILKHLANDNPDYITYL